MNFACAIFLLLVCLVSAVDARGETHGIKKPLKAAACIPTGGKLRNHNTTQLVPDI